MTPTAIPKKTLLAITVASLLSACGGGGGDDTSDVTNTSVQGIASKGVIINGVVTAYPITDGVIGSTPLGSTTTDDNGEYTLSLSDYNGPLHIVVSSDGVASQMKCDAISGCDANNDGIIDTQFGETMNMPANLTMDAIIPNVSGGSVSTAVTPLTSMAAKYAQTYGLSETAIDASIDTVEAMFNVTDLLGTQPTDITDPDAVSGEQNPDALLTAYINAAVAELANNDAEGDIAGTVDTLVDNFVNNNGELVNNLASDEDGTNDANNITLAEITQEVLDAMESPVIADNSALDTSLDNEITQLDQAADAAVEGELTETDIVVTSEELAAAKDVVSTFTTWTITLQDAQTPAKAFEGELAVASATMGEPSHHAANALAATSAIASQAWAVAHNQNATLAAAGKQATFTDSEGSTTMSFNCHGDITVVDNQQFSSTGSYLIDGQTLYVTMDYNEHGMGDFNVTLDGTTLAGSSNATWMGENDLGVVESGSAVVTNVSELESCAMSSNLADWLAPDDFHHVDNATGTVTVTNNTVNISGTLDSMGSMDYMGVASSETNTIAMDYTFPSALSGTSFSASLGGSITNSGIVWTLHNSTEEPSHINVVLAGSTTLPDQFTMAPAINSAELALNATISQVSSIPASFNGALALNVVKAGEVAHIEDVMPGDYNISSMSMSGSFSKGTQSYTASLALNMDNAATFQPVVNLINGDDEDANAWRDLDGTLELTAKLDNLPEAQFSVTVNRTSYDSGEAVVSIEYGNISIVVEASGDESEHTSESMIIVTDTSDANAPVEMIIYPDHTSETISGSISVDGVVVGNISQVGDLPIVNYIDGNFTSLAF